MEVANRLAERPAEIIRLSSLGVRSLNRVLSRAEIESIRKAIGGLVTGERPPESAAPSAPIALVCRGRLVGDIVSAGERIVAVSDHVNLTFRSPLIGPNDDRFGSRFPVTAGLYCPEVLHRLLCGTAIREEVVGEVNDRTLLSAFERRVVEQAGISVVTDELVAAAIIAAHMRTRVAAVILLDEKGWRRGRT